MPETNEEWGIYTYIDTEKLEATFKINQYKAFIKVFYKNAGQKRGRNHFKSSLPEINIPLKFSNP